VATAVLALAGCTAGHAKDGGAPARTGGTPAGSSRPSGEAGGHPTGSSSVASAGPAVISVDRVRSVDPATPITVSIANGALTRVVMKNAAGYVVSGRLSAGDTRWQNTEALHYARTYSITATGRSASGAPVRRTVSVHTLTPANQTMPYLQRIGGYPLGDGQTYGVAIVPVVHFDEPIPDRAAALRALTVRTTPHVDGRWFWATDQDVHFRPRTFWPAGTKVTVSARVYGKNLGHRLYGQADVHASFTVGRKQVTVADDTAPRAVNKVRVYDARGRVLRKMNTSMGQHGGTTVNGNYINFYTLDGTYTVLGHEQPARMCSASYGLPATAQGGYPCENIYNATKISTDGIYLHELDNTVPEQNSGRDVSHGCLNLNYANSRWYFNHSLVGDPVIIHGAHGAPRLQLWEGGDWSVPWATWVRGSAS
jgi:lipoprotein-anchoring transpeptidase ErfK/SrfK